AEPGRDLAQVANADLAGVAAGHGPGVLQHGPERGRLGDVQRLSGAAGDAAGRAVLDLEPLLVPGQDLLPQAAGQVRGPAHPDRALGPGQALEQLGRVLGDVAGPDVELAGAVGRRNAALAEAELAAAAHEDVALALVDERGALGVPDALARGELLLDGGHRVLG